jgi:excisionase family DNA binding protein
MTEPILLTPTEAARALGIGRSKLYELLQAGVLESVHIGACRRIPAEAINDLVAKLRGVANDAKRADLAFDAEMLDRR